jgi:uncharacterized membrane protein YjjP (DUF1212 family)
MQKSDPFDLCLVSGFVGMLFGLLAQYMAHTNWPIVIGAAGIVTITAISFAASLRKP